MDSISSLPNKPLNLTFNHHRPIFSSPISSLSFKTPNFPQFPKPSFPSSKFKFSQIKATQFPSSQNSKPLFSESTNSLPKILLKTSCIAVTIAAFFMARFTLKPSTAMAAPVAMSDVVSEQDQERNIEESLNSNPDDVDSLRMLMELKIKNRKPHEAVEVIERLIELEPNDSEWPLMKCHLLIYSGESELAKAGFEELLAKDPFRVEAYHGLVMAVSQGESGGPELTEVSRRIEDAIEKCKKENKKDVLRDFKLLNAQVKVVESNYNDALKIYQELVKEEPRDFRPYLCQGIIYTLLKKKDEADKQFQKYQKLVPKGHPYAQYLNDNMFATKLFAQKVENEKVASRRS